MDSKRIYKELCETEPQIPIFSKDWWLDTVAGPENWNVALIQNDNRPIAALPYTMKKIGFLKLISMPKLTPMLKIWIHYPANQKYASRIAHEKKIISQLIEQIPSVPRFYQKYHYCLINWLPFYWKGFEQTTRFSYILEDLTDLDRIFTGFRENIRREIRKAEKVLSVIESEDIYRFLELNRMSFMRQDKDLTYSEELVRRIDTICKEKKCRKIWFAEDARGQIHAANYIIWDEQSAYYLMGGLNPELRSSGASSLLMWQAIQFAATVTKNFDFEGSMIEPIERYFRAFGGVLKPYFAISKKNLFFKIIEIFN